MIANRASLKQTSGSFVVDVFGAVGGKPAVCGKYGRWLVIVSLCAN